MSGSCEEYLNERSSTGSSEASPSVQAADLPNSRVSAESSRLHRRSRRVQSRNRSPEPRVDPEFLVSSGVPVKPEADDPSPDRVGCPDSPHSRDEARSAHSSNIVSLDDEIEIGEGTDYLDAPFDSEKSLCDADSLSAMTDFCNSPRRVYVVCPTPEERVFKCPDGYISLYEPFFTKEGLRFLIPAFLMEYCWRRQIAITQLTVHTIRNMVGLKHLADQCGINLTAYFVEDMMRFTRQKGFNGIWYASATPGYKLMDHPPSKTHTGLNRYFYAKVDDALVEDTSIGFKTEWNLSHDLVDKSADPPTPDFFEVNDLLRRQTVLDWRTIPQLDQTRGRKPSKGGSSQAKMVKMGVPKYSGRPVSKKKNAAEEKELQLALKRSMVDHSSIQSSHVGGASGSRSSDGNKSSRDKGKITDAVRRDKDIVPIDLMVEKDRSSAKRFRLVLMGSLCLKGLGPPRWIRRTRVSNLPTLSTSVM
ncbi:PREDICTED: uncharacterized protein At3g60930, chloroplastic-like [Camelina sativa]|uniref:Uncharacterized protein At3g60930, chloroplastic-like n=1 Tax=Camelina sativa TaxID=90675 RepID=A0ABM1QQW6_CAMSA|nr:PREDICTED: uncharacterized protein At3g60930, chloroplastic-like [Camelina sativa]